MCGYHSVQRQTWEERQIKPSLWAHTQFQKEISKKETLRGGIITSILCSFQVFFQPLFGSKAQLYLRRREWIRKVAIACCIHLVPIFISQMQGFVWLAVSRWNWRERPELFCNVETTEKTETSWPSNHKLCVIKFMSNKLIKATLISSRTSNVCESYTVGTNQTKRDRTSKGYFSENNNS